jgi:CDP-4-dehydro-6-deoxyglucose reductase, E1
MKKIHLAEDTISREEIVDLSKWLLTADKLTKGHLTKEFEEKFAKWQGSKYAVYVNSGSSANHLMAYALLEGGYLKNKVAIAPSVSWCTSVTPFIQFGYDVHLCDCDKDDLGLNIEHFEKLCKEYSPSVVLLVHVLGHPNKLDKILEICKKYGVILLEDTCESMATEYKNKKLGSFGLAGSFSLYYGHHISTVEGGMVVTDDEKFYNLCLSIRSHGWSRDVDSKYKTEWSKDYDIDEVRDLYTFYYSGFNFRNTDIGAFLGLGQLKKIDGYAKIRQRNYKIYREELKDYWAQTSNNSFLSSFAYGVIVENRLEVYKHLLENGIENRPLICGNIGLHPFWIKKYGKTNLPIADIIHFNGLYLPNHAQLSEDEVRFICQKV